MADERPSAAARIRAVHPRPDEERHMPYAPAVSVAAPADILFISGSTSSPLYHRHPHVAEEHRHPIDIESQTHRAMAGIKLVLDAEGLSWRHVVKVTKYLTDMRDMDGMVAVLAEYFGDWKPASTTICINALSTPGARVELDMIVARPRD
jgi:enamine deaminase RidA (YjgF/YER057c/UK114 family)